MKGKLIVIEGVDGAGKGTQTEILVKKLEQEGKKVRKMSFPRYDTFFGKEVKAYLRGEFGTLEQIHPKLAALFFELDRLEATKEIKKHIKEGYYVICDRYFISNHAHQGSKFKDREKRKDFINWLLELELEHLKLAKEDYVIFLDLPTQNTAEAVASRGREMDIHEKDKAYLEETRKAYVELCAERKNCFVINCMKNSSERKTIDEVAADVWRVFSEKILK